MKKEESVKRTVLGVERHNDITRRKTMDAPPLGDEIDLGDGVEDLIREINTDPVHAELKAAILAYTTVEEYVKGL